jgi:diguanylate cyclase (GGDEF)-like protein/PAS domain S-box-containing protein
MRGFADLLTVAACGVVCIILMRVAWKLRGRVPFILAGGMLIVALIGVVANRSLDFVDFRYQLAAGDHRLHAVSALVMIVVSASVLVLSPFLRRVVEFGLTADEEHQRFLTATETSLHAFCILKTIRSPFRGITDFTVLFANAVAEQHLGIEQEPLAGKALSEVLPHVKESGILRRLKHVAQTGIPYQGQVKDKGRFGKELWFSLRAVKTDEGVALVLHDLSEERQRQHHLEEMVRFSQSIIEDAPFSIIAVDKAGIITAVNGAAQTLTQYHRDELVGKHSLLILHDPSEVSARSVLSSRGLNNAVAAGFETLIGALGRRKSNESEWSYVRKDGRKISVHLAMTALRDPENQTTGYLAIAFDVSERKALTDSISFMAHHDSLTKLPNRALLNKHLEDSIEQAAFLSRRVAVFVLDLDHFKRINDSLGHGAGDELLVAVAALLKQTTRATDLVARTGGDEFIVMMPNAGDVDDVRRSGQRLVDALHQPLHVAGRELNVTASVGLCMFPELAKDSLSLLRNADTAMYAAKHKGRDSFHAFSEEMQEASADRLELEAELRRALEQQELMVYYQPQVNTRTHELTGLEALLRWNHPTRGMVPPMEFIQAAEESGMIVPIGEWVVRQACREARQMQIATGHRFTIAVNLSPRQVLQNNLFEVVEAALNDSGLAAMDLELEITENTLMISTSETLATLARLRQLGVRLAVDDFGTGFSSFQYILDYKVDRLKIDRSFTANCASDTTAAAIVRTVIAMAHGLNMTVVAEGVENDEQLAFLHRRRCDVAQGYLFGRPVPMAELEGVIATSAAGDSYSLKRMLAEGSTAKPKSEAVMAFTEATIAIG